MRVHKLTLHCVHTFLQILPIFLSWSYARLITVHKTLGKLPSHRHQFEITALKSSSRSSNLFKRQPIVELCDSVSYSSPHWLGPLQTASDNDVAYSIMGVNTCVAAAGGGRVESADVSTEWGDNMRLELNLWEGRKSSTTQALVTPREARATCFFKSCFSQLIYFSRQGQACLPDLRSARDVSVGEK